MKLKFSNLKRAPKRGISLLESLIALIVFAVGMLGLGGMYLFALKSQSDAKARAAITAQTASMMDRIIANGTVAINSNGYDRAFGGAAPTAAVCASYRRGDTYASRSAFAGALAPIPLAQAEVTEFYNEVACSLPGGDVEIVSNQVPTAGQPPCTAALIAAPGLMTIRIRWTDTRSDAQTGGDNANRFECYNVAARVVA